MAELKSLVLTNEDLDQLSEITNQDLVNANIAWVQQSPRWAKNLLIADQSEEPEGE